MPTRYVSKANLKALAAAARRARGGAKGRGRRGGRGETGEGGREGGGRGARGSVGRGVRRGVAQKLTGGVKQVWVHVFTCQGFILVPVFLSHSRGGGGVGVLRKMQMVAFLVGWLVERESLKGNQAFWWSLYLQFGIVAEAWFGLENPSVSKTGASPEHLESSVCWKKVFDLPPLVLNGLFCYWKHSHLFQDT